MRFSRSLMRLGPVYIPVMVYIAESHEKSCNSYEVIDFL